MTPSLRFSKTSYASSILESGKRWVIRGVVSIFPWAIKSRISSQSHPSTPPVLKIRFLPYKRKHLRLVIHRNNSNDGIRTGTLPGKLEGIRSTCNLHHHISSPMLTILLDESLAILRVYNHHLRIMLLDELSPSL